jgi:hypothetical protein
MLIFSGFFIQMRPYFNACICSHLKEVENEDIGMHSNILFRYFLTKFVNISRFQLLKTSLSLNELRYFQTNFVIFKRTSLILKKVRF